MNPMDFPGGSGRIDGPNGPNRIDPSRRGDGVGPTDGVDPTKQAEFERRLGGVAPNAPTDSASEVRPSAYDEMRARILAHLNEGASRDQILDRLVGDELQRDFGSRAGQEFVSSKVRESPELRRMFDRLVAEVERER